MPDRQNFSILMHPPFCGTNSRRRWDAASLLISLAVMCVGTVAIVGMYHAARGDGVQLLVDPPGARRAAARGRARQARLAMQRGGRHPEIAQPANLGSAMSEVLFPTGTTPKPLPCATSFLSHHPVLRVFLIASSRPSLSNSLLCDDLN